MSVPTSFLRNVTVSIDAEDRMLTAQACIGDQCFEKVIDLEPLAQFIAEQLAAYHASLHGETSVAGLGSFLRRAKDAAKRIASSSAVQALYKKALPIAASAIPGGSTALVAAQSTYEVVKDAKKGHPKAIATLQRAIDKANSGDPLAAQLVETAKKLSALHDAKAAKDPTDIAHRVARIEQSLNPLVRTSGTDIVGFSFSNALKKVAKYSPPGLLYQGAKQVVRHPQYAIPGYLAYRGAKSALTRHPSRTVPTRDHRALGHAPAPPRVMAPSPYSAMDDGGDGGGFSDTSVVDIQEPDEMVVDTQGDVGTFDVQEADEMTEVSGWREWFHHKPFRGTVEAALQGDYGVSGNLRGAYAGGLSILMTRGK